MINDLQAERAVIASCLLSESSADYAVETLTGDEFTSLALRDVFCAIKELRDANEPIDILLIRNKVEAKPSFVSTDVTPFLVEILDEIASGANVSKYCAILTDCNLRQQVITGCTNAIADCKIRSRPIGGLVEGLEEHILGLTDRKAKDTLTSSSELSSGIVDDMLRRAKTGEKFTGLASGYNGVDKHVGGFRPGEFIIMAARPSMGKTTFAMNILRNMSMDAQVPTLLISLEMTKEELGYKLLSMLSGQNTMLLRNVALTDEEMNDIIVKHAPEMYEAKLYIDDNSSMNISKIRRRARQMHRRHGIKAVVIDYIQLIRGERGIVREEQVQQISWGLKSLAKELKIPVIALCQLNRSAENNRDHVPTMSNLRESGSLEQDADIVILLHRPEYYDNSVRIGQMDVIVGKNRNGPTGIATLRYDRGRNLITSLIPEIVG